jgi:hypothetical protein
MAQYFQKEDDPLDKIYKAAGIISSFSSVFAKGIEERGNAAKLKIDLIATGQDGRLLYPTTYDNDLLESQKKDLQALVSDGDINLDKIDLEIKEYYNSLITRIDKQKILNDEYDTITLTGLPELEKSLIQGLTDFRKDQFNSLNREDWTKQFSDNALSYAEAGLKLKNKFGDRLRNDQRILAKLASYEFTATEIFKQLNTTPDLILDDTEFEGIVNSILHTDPKFITKVNTDKALTNAGESQVYVAKIESLKKQYEDDLVDFQAEFGQGFDSEQDAFGAWLNSDYGIEDSKISYYNSQVSSRRLALQQTQHLIEEHQKEYARLNKGNKYNLILNPIQNVVGKGFAPGSGVSRTQIKVGGQYAPSAGLIDKVGTTFSNYVTKQVNLQGLKSSSIDKMYNEVLQLKEDKVSGWENKVRAFNSLYNQLDNIIKNDTENPNINSISDYYPGIKQLTL